MKCNNCGYESEQAFAVCSACGAAAEQDYVTVNVAYRRILTALKDKLFLAICILMTVACGLNIAEGGFPLISILTTVFLWLVYSKANKGVVDVNNMRCVSGTVYATYVITNVLAVFIALMGVLFGVAFSFIVDNLDMMADLRDMLTQTEGVDSELLVGAGWIFATVFIVMAGFILLINILGYRKIHRLAKTAYQSVETGNFNMIENPKGAKNWLWFFGICEIISPVLTIATTTDAVAYMSILMSLCSAAATIIAAILVKRYINIDNSIFT